MRKINLRFLVLLFLPVFVSLTQGVFSQTISDKDMTAANQAYAAKDYLKAKGLYQAIIQNNSLNAAAFQGLGNCEYALGNKAQALESYNNSLAVYPSNQSLAAFVEKLKKQIAATQPAAQTATALVATTTPVAEHIWKRGGSFDYRGPEYDLSLGPAFGLGGTGLGMDETVYFMNGGMFALGFAGNVYLFGLNSPTLTYCGEGLLQLRVTFGGAVARPYILAGRGLNAIYNSNGFSNPGSNYTFSFVTDPMMVAGGGVLFSIGQYFRLFLQAKASIVFLTGVNTNITSQGYNQTQSSGGTLVYYPAQFGFAAYF